MMTSRRPRSCRADSRLRPLLRAVLLACMACGPRAHIPPVPSPVSLPGAVPPSADAATLARTLAPVLYLQKDEWFPLDRVVAVIHPTRRVIAYNLLWRDDIHGSWIPFTVPTDQEVLWIGYDSTYAPTDVWTYWHGSILHTPWPRRQVVIDIQWGKHGSLPSNTFYSDLPESKKLNSFWFMSYALLPDIWLGRLTRKGPMCFCHGYKRYREFTRPMPLTDRIDAFLVTQDPGPALTRVFGAKYSRKKVWPDEPPPAASAPSR
jgi:hypothetical protein